MYQPTKTRYQQLVIHAVRVRIHILFKSIVNLKILSNNIKITEQKTSWTSSFVFEPIPNINFVLSEKTQIKIPVTKPNEKKSHDNKR